MQGIKYRKKEEAVGGWFSQIGEMHVVHHLWGRMFNYFLSRVVDDIFLQLIKIMLIAMKHVKLLGKCQDGMSVFYELVSSLLSLYKVLSFILILVPLIRHMEARIMTPTVFSPLQ